jgi:hypothetical protein
VLGLSIFSGFAKNTRGIAMGPKMATIIPQIAVGLTWRRLAMNMHTKAASNQINAGKYVLMLNSSDSVLQLKIQLNPI